MTISYCSSSTCPYSSTLIPISEKFDLKPKSKRLPSNKAITVDWIVIQIYILKLVLKNNWFVLPKNWPLMRNWLKITFKKHCTSVSYIKKNKKLKLKACEGS